MRRYRQAAWMSWTVLGVVAVKVTRMVPSTVIGEEFNLLTWVMMGNVVSSLMDIVCNVDRGRIVS